MGAVYRPLLATPCNLTEEAPEMMIREFEEIKGSGKVDEIQISYQVCEQVLVRTAKVIISTCSASTCRLLYHFYLRISIIDQGSQASEQHVAPIAAFSQCLKNVTIIGDFHETSIFCS